MRLSAALAATLLTGLSTAALAKEIAVQVAPPRVALEANQIVLKNDGFVDEGGQAFLQLGFVQGEMAGVWLQVPAEIPYFQVDSFRVLFGEALVTPEFFAQGFFQVGRAAEPTPNMPSEVSNAVELTPGPYWNDIPVQGDGGAALGCVRGGEYVGAALEFTHTGAPSVYRDLDGMSDLKHNTIMAIPGGWAYSAQYGLRGDWVMRVVGHEASAADCGL
jgi:hypothetical protein